MQVLLGTTHTVFRVDGYIDEYLHIINYIKDNFPTKRVKENIFFIPHDTGKNDKRKFLMKWLYSYYKKSAINFKEHLKFELLNRVDKPIHIHFLARKNEVMKISTTFYDNHICQLILENKNEACNLFLMQYFSGCIRLKSINFNLYELKIITQKQKTSLHMFLQKKQLHDISVEMHFNKRALELFLNINKALEKPELSKELTKALALFNVKESDSLLEIKKIYKKLAKTYHPDLSSLEYQESTKKFQTLSDAFSLIKKYKAAA